MTLDELINTLVEAREHFVPSQKPIKVYKIDVTTLGGKPEPVGIVYDVDYDNNGVNIYIEDE